jgi:hypothetical protein
MKTINANMASDIAKKFSEVLRDWLTKEEMQNVVDRNRSQTDESICHSHDFCDANMAMDEAFTAVVGRQCNLQNQYEIKRWGHAWDIAQRNEFYTKAT